MVDIKEPRNSLIDYLVFRYFPLLALPIGAGMAWMGHSLLGIRDFAWLALFVGLTTAAITAAIVYGMSVLAEPRSRRIRR
jgi:apolipoprotein N-acyltransferase